LMTAFQYDGQIGRPNRSDVKDVKILFCMQPLILGVLETCFTNNILTSLTSLLLGLPICPSFTELNRIAVRHISILQTRSLPVAQIPGDAR